MAKKDKINVRGSLFDTVNLNYRVGRGAENRPDDVMLVQALFRWIAYNPGAAKGQLGVSMSELPQITGTCDAVTQKVILAFQWKNSGKLLNVDGVIHPASYENRRLNYPAGGSTRLMAITLLCDLALDAGPARQYAGTFIQGLVELEPRLKQALS
jgi:hypothetical protein